MSIVLLEAAMMLGVYYTPQSILALGYGSGKTAHAYIASNPPFQMIQEGTMTEHELQASIIAQCDWRANQDPRWGLVMAIPNGQYRKGQRMEPGLRPGVPDLFLPVARHGYHGLWMELKVGRNKQSVKQVEWVGKLWDLGYHVIVVRDAVEYAIDVIDWYLNGKEEPLE